MNKRGRIIVISVIWGTFLIGIIYLEITDGKLHYVVISVTLIIYTLIGWFMGRHYDQLQFYAIHDELTNTYNRRYVYSIFPKMKAKANRREQKLILYIIDVNDFKEVNDRYGHAVGDMVLKSISTILNGMKGEDDVIARWGGDEFIMIAFNAGHEIAKIDSFSIETGISEFNNKINDKISLSIGQSVYPDEAQSLGQLLKIADDNMYGLKQVQKDYDI